MCKEYNDILIEHRHNIRKAYSWIKENLPELLIPEYSYLWNIYYHDESKLSYNEYQAFNEFTFYERTEDVINKYRRAQLEHRHKNPHHWEYWVLQTSDTPPTPLDMDYPYIIEMICDWWSFSWAADNLFLIFYWYDKHKDNIMMSDKTRTTVEDILDKIYNKLIKEMLL